MITWDEHKSHANLKKHGISFELAKLVFDDPLHVSRQDRIERGEVRWQTVGMVGDLILVLVAHTWIETDMNDEHIRIISARRATKIERKIYEQSTDHSS